jgi:hypothetical protein
MVNFTMETKEKVEFFIRKKGKVLQTESQFLGKKNMQIKLPTIRAILKTLEKEKKIKINKFSIGKSNFIMIEWISKNNKEMKK